VAILISMLAVLIPPIRVKNPSSPMSPTILVATIAACDDEKPGRKAAINPTPLAAPTDLGRFLLESSRGELICFGMVEFSDKLTIRILTPKRPERSGKSGCVRLEFRVRIPTIPANRKTRKLLSRLFLSFKIM